MKYYKRIDRDGNTTTVESYNHDKPVKGALPISKAEFEAFIASLPTSEPSPDYKKLYNEAATDKARLDVIAKVTGLQ